MERKKIAFDTIKVPPHNLEAEQGLICSVLVRSKYLPEILQIISAEDFYRESHELIFQAITELYESKKEINLLSIREQLADNYDRAGGDEYLTSLVDMATVSVTWKHYSTIIRNLADKRKTIQICSEVSEGCFTEWSDLDSSLSKLKEGIVNIENKKTTEIETNKKLYDDVYHNIYERKAPGLYPGIECLDQKIYFEKGYAHAIAAESGVGKSAFLLQVGRNISKKYGACLFYSLESTRHKLALRQIALESRIALTRLNKCKFIDEVQENKIIEAVSNLSDSRLILIDDTRYQEIEKLTAHAESYALRNQLSAIFIDFLQLISSRKQQKSRHLEISYIINQIKQLAKNLNVPVIFASQLRKDVGGRPKLDDLKESGDIRTHTDNILFLYAVNSDPTIYQVECFLGKGKEQERFSQWLEFNGNFQVFYEGYKPESKNTQEGFQY